MPRFVKVLIVTAACFAATSCGNGSDPASLYQSLRIAPLNATVRTGTAGIFVAIAFAADGTATDVTTSVSWKSSVPTVLSVERIGQFTADSDGSAVISATLGGMTVSAPLTVSDTAPTLLNVSIGLPSIGGNGITVAGLQFQAIAFYDDGSKRDVTHDGIWVSNNVTVSVTDSSGNSVPATVVAVEFYYGLNFDTYKVTHLTA